MAAIHWKDSKASYRGYTGPTPTLENVKQAEAQFREARALVLGEHANYYPTIGSSPGITQTYERKQGSYNYTLPITASWEPDLWGRVRLSVENAVDNAQVSAAELENMRLSQQALLAGSQFSFDGQHPARPCLSSRAVSWGCGFINCTPSFSASRPLPTFRNGTIRFTFGFPELADGFQLVALALGLFGVAEFLRNVNRMQVVDTGIRLRIRDMRPSKAELKQAFFPMVRGTLMGTL